MLKFRLYIFYTMTFLVIFILTFDAAAQVQEIPTIPERWDYDITMDERVEQVTDMPTGPFVRLGEGQILSASGSKNVLISKDNGQTWDAYPVFEDSENFIKVNPAVQRTDDGIVIIAFANSAERHWTWDDELGDAPGARLPTYVGRSLDNGRTWEQPVKLHEEWTGMNTDMIITSDGNVVFTSMKMRHNPGRHTVLTYFSADQGETWQPSNIIDLGGAGHHGGVTEATLEELRNGRLLMFMRTNWMQLWRVESNNGGRSWHPLGPSGIPASSTHARLTRLESGRLLLVWNRPYPEGESSYPKIGGDNIWSAVPVSNFRGELSIAFSEDEGETWTDPVVIAKSMEDREVAYPFVFEAAPGEIWVTTQRGPLRAKIYEHDFIN